MRKLFPAAALAVLYSFGSYAAVAVSSPAAAQVDEKEEKRRNSQTLGSKTAQDLGKALDAVNAEPADYATAMNLLNGLANRDLPPYDLSTVLEIRGAVYAQTDKAAESLRDFVRVLEIDALPFDRLKQIRYNVAQLYFVEGNYAQAIRFMREYLAGADNVEDANAWYILAAAYVSQDDYQNARGPAEKVIQYDAKKQKKNYDLLNLIYSQLNLNVERGRLLETMIELFPNQTEYWAQLSGAYSQAGRDKDAFSTLEVAYKAGLIKDEPKIVALAQYYSALDDPYRGAKLIEQEMATGTVKKTLKNLELLAQLWSMSRDQKKAIAALDQAAKLSDNGQLYYRLGQSYMADEQYSEAATNLNQALQKGGLSERDRGDIYLLLGAAYFNMDSDTAAGRNRARRAFAQAANYANARTSARGWVGYIDAIEETLRAQDEVERLQREEQRRRNIERCESIVDVAELGGTVEESRLSECRTVLARAAAGEEIDEPATEEAPEEAEDAATEEEPSAG
ncbi:hypothetical protein [Parvularcula sp. LCG005]|uniref:tetratricopeptide repeat protein n=1 Tax=Parvularcula sp. LCG005 TaxID=3078805 RepID=UPI0029431A1B|nr:hypothetical protein [Parvularcula sp. LCG005]WOI53626.1 hypothetical protein RUI03_01200 [Parvularcula sp. LCG005]